MILAPNFQHTPFYSVLVGLSRSNNDKDDSKAVTQTDLINRKSKKNMSLPWLLIDENTDENIETHREGRGKNSLAYADYLHRHSNPFKTEVISPHRVSVFAR